MQQNDLETLMSIKNTLEAPLVNTHVQHAIIDNPAKEVETSLASFLRHRLNKLQDATNFEEQIKDILLTRLSEATFPQLIGLLEVVQKNNNIATEKILAPFITQAGGRTLTETMKTADTYSDNPASRVYAETEDKKILQSLQALSQFLELAKSSANSSCVDRNDGRTS